MDVQEVFNLAFQKYGKGKVIVATKLLSECQCKKEVVVLPSGHLYCSECYGFWDWKE